MIGEDGIVEGEIDVARCLIGGRVDGVVRASEKVILHASAKVNGEVHAPAVVMEEGAFLEGRVDMASGKAAAGPASKKDAGAKP